MTARKNPFTRSRVRRSTLTAGLLAASVSAVAPGAVFATPVTRAPRIIATIPSHLIATAADGRAVDIATQPGWRVVYFWSMECPCVSACEQYSFIPLSKRYAGKVSFYGVVSGAYDLDQGIPTIISAIKDRSLPYPVLLDKTHTVAKALSAEVTPQAFLLDPQNHVIFEGMADDSRRFFKHEKPAGYEHTFLSDALDEALAGKPIAHPTNELQGCIIAW